MADVRNFKLPGVWAKNAYTTIPVPPVVNLAYRNENLSQEDIEQGQLFGALGNSADWNQMLWLLSALADEGQNQGILSWSPQIDYAVGAWVMGANGNTYIALKASGPATTIVNPATEEESEDMTWLDVTEKLSGGLQPYNQNPANLGTASPGVSPLYARGDHVHATDIVSTIIYPNGGSAGAEANISVNQRVVMDNPFSGYFVQCEVQVKFSNDKWGAPCWFCTPLLSSSYTQSQGVMAHQLLPDDKIVVQSGNTFVTSAAVYVGSPDGGNDFLTTAPCRVIVTRLGKM